MSKNGYQIMDSDMHVFEPHGMWRRYIDPEFRDHAPEEVGEQAVKLDGMDLLGVPVIDTDLSREGNAQEQARRDRIFKESIELGWGPESQLFAMDKEGIDQCVLFPTRALFTHAVDGMDPRLGAAIGKAYDDWMHEFCSKDPSRMYGAAHISPHDVELAVMQTRRAVEDLGFRAIFLRSNVANERNWHDSYYDPLWAECQSLGIAVAFHGAANPKHMSPIAKVGEHFESLMLQHTAWHPVPIMFAVMSFCAGGILERFPDLRVAFLEGNASWIPWLMWRLDEKYQWRGHFEAPGLSMLPNEYFKRQCFASTDCDEWPSKYLEDAGYSDNIVFSTDYPHSDSKYPEATDEFFRIGISPEARRKYLWDNCARLYGFA